MQVERDIVPRGSTYGILHMGFHGVILPASSAEREEPEANLPRDEEGEDRKGLLTQSLEYTRTAKRAAGERALCVLRHPRPFPLSIARDRSMIPPSMLRRGRRRWARREYPDHPLHGAVARQPREGERRVFQRFAMLSRSSLPPPPPPSHVTAVVCCTRHYARATVRI